MKPGNKIILLISICVFFSNFSSAEQKITTTPLINIDQIKPTFENFDEKNENISSNKNLKEKRNIKFAIIQLF